MGENKIFLGSKILEVRAFQALSPVRLSVTDDELDDEGDNDFFLYLFHQSALGRRHRGRVHVMSRRLLHSVRHRTSKPPSYVLHVIPFLRYYYDDENDEAIPHICHESHENSRVNFFGRCKFLQI